MHKRAGHCGMLACKKHRRRTVGRRPRPHTRLPVSAKGVVTRARTGEKAVGHFDTIGPDVSSSGQQGAEVVSITKPHQENISQGSLFVTAPP